ncbi:MAG: maleylpyruvate isomerase N-terminal domain-containing protein [Bacteroidota bacterium]
MGALPIIDTRSLFRPLDHALQTLLAEMQPVEWELPTVAGTWLVKDVVAHLLDGNLRALSMQRDGYFGEAPPDIEGYDDLVGWLNELNATWVSAMKRVSPKVLTFLHEVTGPATCDYYSSLDPMATAVFAVDWAGEEESLNWMHLAREYSEKWHHQQQIRDAAGLPGIMGSEFFVPFMDTYLRGLPHTFRSVEAPLGTSISVTIDTAGTWYMEKTDASWELFTSPRSTPAATITLDPDLAWKLFSKNIRPEAVTQGVSLSGDEGLARHVLQMVAVMA